MAGGGEYFFASIQSPKKEASRLLCPHVAARHIKRSYFLYLFLFSPEENPVQYKPHLWAARTMANF